MFHSSSKSSYSMVSASNCFTQVYFLPTMYPSIVPYKTSLQTSLTHVWILIRITCFIRHVCAPYNNTHLAGVLDRQTYLSAPDFCRAYSSQKGKAATVSMIFVLSATAVLLGISSMLSRYLTVSTSSGGSPSVGLLFQTYILLSETFTSEIYDILPQFYCSALHIYLWLWDSIAILPTMSMSSN